MRSRCSSLILATGGQHVSCKCQGPKYNNNHYGASIVIIVHRVILHSIRIASEPLNEDIINTLRPRRNEQHFADGIFKRIFFNENV